MAVLSALITDFLEYLEIEKGASRKTIQNYDHYLKRFLEFVRSAGSGRVGDINPEEIDLPLVRKYHLYLERFSDPKTKKSLKRVTQNYFMIALRVFLRYLARQDIKTFSPEKVKLGEIENVPIKALDEDSLGRLLKAPNVLSKQGLRDKALLGMLFSTGLRVSELSLLNRDAINLGKKEVSVAGKGPKERVVFLSDEAAKWLGEYLKSRKSNFKPLFIRFQGKINPRDDGEDMRLTPRSIQRIVEKYAKLTGLPVRVTPSILRHSFAKGVLQKGEDLKSLQGYLGHQHLSSTKVYTQLR